MFLHGSSEQQALNGEGGRDGGRREGWRTEGREGGREGRGKAVREDRREGSRADPLPLFTAKYVSYH